MFSLERSLAPSHSLLIHHLKTFTPQQLRGIVECYGILDDMLSYHLKENLDYVSVIQHRDLASRELCYCSLRALISSQESPIKKVAWIHEEAVALLKQKNYIQSNCSNAQDTEISPPKGCLVLYLLGIPTTIRQEILASVASQKGFLDCFVDAVNGGRCFLCYPTVEAAEHMRRTIAHLHPEYKNDVHYCDYNDLLLAKEKEKQI
ncbi:hypothetical protein TCSYLVIO_001054 [Trypanosoma cruzi]|nr:hypothetical protein TCSYLVIO_001054 [Trypanosoma cruzi]